MKRNILDDEALQHLANSDLILVADTARMKEIRALLADRPAPPTVMLFYEYIDEGSKDFVNTYDADSQEQDPARFARCFDELERIARRAVKQIQKTI